MEQARAARITILEDGEGKEAPRILQKLMKITSQRSNRRKLLIKLIQILLNWVFLRAVSFINKQI